MLIYLSADIICSEKRTVFRERSSRKTVSFEEQIMSKDKYLSIFLKSNGGYCVYYPSNIFRNMRESHGNRQDLPFCHMSITSKFVSWSFKISTSDFASGRKRLERKVNLFNSVKDKSKIQVADKVTGNLTTSREQAKDH